MAGELDLDALNRKVSRIEIELGRFTTLTTLINSVQTSVDSINSDNDNTIQSLLTDGYKVFPGGLILQWGTSLSIADGGVRVIDLPYTFPNACLSVVTSNKGVGAGNWGAVNVEILSTSQIKLARYNGGSNSTPSYWAAIGY